jgi:hypothetical protein
VQQISSDPEYELVAKINRELHKANNNSFFMAFLLSVEWLVGQKSQSNGGTMQVPDELRTECEFRAFAQQEDVRRGLVGP